MAVVAHGRWLGKVRNHGSVVVTLLEARPPGATPGDSVTHKRIRLTPDAGSAQPVPSLKSEKVLPSAHIDPSDLQHAGGCTAAGVMSNQMWTHTQRQNTISQL